MLKFKDVFVFNGEGNLYVYLFFFLGCFSIIESVGDSGDCFGFGLFYRSSVILLVGRILRLVGEVFYRRGFL